MRHLWRMRPPRGPTGPTEAAESLGKLTLVQDRALVKAVLLDDFAVMQHVKLLGGLLPCKKHDGLLAAGVVPHEVSHIIHIVTHDDPTILLGGVLGNLVCCDRHGEKEFATNEMSKHFEAQWLEP